MTDNALPVSVRATLSRWFVPLVLVFLVFAGVGGFVTYNAHVAEAETVTEQQTAGVWTVESEFEHGTTVQRETAVFSPGDELDNRPLYFTTAMPELEGRYTISHENPEGTTATASIELTLVIQSVETTDNGEEIHWQVREPLSETTDFTIGEGNTRTETVTIEIPPIRDRIDSIENDLGASPGETEVLVTADTELESTIAGEQLTDTRTDRLEIVPDGAVYRVSAGEQTQQSHEATEEVRRTIEPSRLAQYGGPLLVALGVLSILVLTVANWLGLLAVSDREQQHRSFVIDRKDFDKWISNARIPEGSDRTTVPADSLSDLVDIAIDSDRRVIEDGDRYAVLVDDIMYTYTAPTASEPLAESTVGNSQGMAVGHSDSPRGSPSGTVDNSTDTADQPDTSTDGSAADHTEE